MVIGIRVRREIYKCQYIYITRLFVRCQHDGRLAYFFLIDKCSFVTKYGRRGSSRALLASNLRIRL